MNIAIIPARGGSKRIPKKNIRKFVGRPIISYSIEIAKKSGLFERVIVSTDNDEISEIAINNSITALILTNTTNVNRNNLIESQKNEIGGLSGKPLEDISNNIIKKFYKKLNGKIIIIGVGGVDSGKSAYNKIISGASLVQLYTGMIFKGPEVVKNIKKDLINHLKNDGVKNFKEIIGQGI